MTQKSFQILVIDKEMRESVQTEEGSGVQSCRRIGSVWPRCALPHSVATIRPTAGRRPRQKARSSTGAPAGLCSKLRIPRGSPACSRSFLQQAPHCRHVCESQHAAAAGSCKFCCGNSFSCCTARGKPLHAAAACRVPLQTCLLRKTAQLLCKKLLTRLQTLRQLELRPFSKAANSSGKPSLATNASFQLERTGLPAMQDARLLQTILQSFSNSFRHMQIICPYPPNHCRNNYL